MPRARGPRTAPQVFLSDEEVKPEDILPPRRHPTDDPAPDDDPADHPDEADDSYPIDEPDDADDLGFPDPNPDPDEKGDKVAIRDYVADAGIPQAGNPVAAPVANPTQTPKPTPLVTYRSRISVMEAWRYPGNLAGAPDFVDRNWASWADSDQIYGRPAGPALRVPVTSSLSGPVPHDGVKVCMAGDYVVRQNVTMADGIEPEEVIDVWPKEEFERLFIPTEAPKPSKRKAA